MSSNQFALLLNTIGGILLTPHFIGMARLSRWQHALVPAVDKAAARMRKLFSVARNWSDSDRTSLSGTVPLVAAGVIVWPAAAYVVSAMLGSTLDPSDLFREWRGGVLGPQSLSLLVIAVTLHTASLFYMLLPHRAVQRVLESAPRGPRKSFGTALDYLLHVGLVPLGFLIAVLMIGSLLVAALAFGTVKGAVAILGRLTQGLRTPDGLIGILAIIGVSLVTAGNAIQFAVSD